MTASAAERWAWLDRRPDGTSFDEVTAAAGIVGFRLPSPGGHAMDLNYQLALYWPLVPRLLQEHDKRHPSWALYSP